MNIWQELGIAATRERGEIRRAYAQRLKKVHPEEDPAGFQRLRQAYELALQLAAHAPAADFPPAPPNDARASSAPVAVPPQARAKVLVEELERPPPVGSAVQILFERLSTSAVTEQHRILREQFKRPNWQQLDFRDALARHILQRLVQESAKYGSLMALFIQYYGWSHAETRVGPMDPLVIELLERNKAYQWRTALEGVRSPTGVKRRQRLAAFRLLSGAPDETAFYRYARRPSNRQAMFTVLAELHATQPQVLRYEVNRESLRWWLAHRDDYLDIPQAMPVTLCMNAICIGLALWWVLKQAFGGMPRADPETRVFVSAAIVFSGIPLVLALNWIRARTPRDGLERVLGARTIGWLRGRYGRLLFVLIVVVSVGLTAQTGIDQRWGWAAVPAVLVLMAWQGVESAFVGLTLVAWPVQVPLSQAIHALFQRYPALARWSPEEPIFFFPHMAAAFMSVLLLRGGFRIQRWLGTTAEAPGVGTKMSYFLVACCCALVFLGAFGWPKPPPKPTFSAKWHAPKLPWEHAVESDTSILTPMAGRRTFRPISEVNPVVARQRGAFQAVLARYYAAHPSAPSGYIRCGYWIQPDGRAADVYLIQSTYNDPTTVAGILNSLRALRFAPNHSYLPTQITFALGKAP